MVWPTESTHWYLFLGMLPLIYLAVMAFRNGLSEFFSLRVITVLILWVGYQLSPWIGFVQGDYWDSFLLSPGYLDTAILFSAVSMFAILIGYGFVFKRKHAKYRRRAIEPWVMPKVHWGWVVFFSFVLLSLTVFIKGGIQDFWDASYSRGEFQWEKKTVEVKFQRGLAVVVAPLVVFVTALGSLHILYRSRHPIRYLVGFIAIFIAMLPTMHGFSRMAGFPLLLFAYLIFRYRVITPRSLIAMTLLVAAAMFMGNVGYEQRGNYTPGVGNYFFAALGGNQKANTVQIGGGMDPGKNTLDATAPFTRQAEVREVMQEETGLQNLPFFLFHINPIPSGFLDPGRIGMGLAEYMGTEGRVGLTTPALADLFKTFGFGSFVVLLLLGVVFGYIDRYALRHGGMIGQIVVLLIIIGTGVSLHGGIRAWTRPIFYAAILIAVTGMIERRRRRRHKRIKGSLKNPPPLTGHR